MTDAITFGSAIPGSAGATSLGGAPLGKAFGSSFGGGADAAGTGANGADVPPSSGAPLSLAPPPAFAPPPQPSTPSIFGTPDPSQPAPQSQGLFGSGLNVGGFGQPKYTAPDPNATALDQSADLLQQQIKIKSNAASNPIANFFDPEGAAKARAAVPALTEQLQQIQQQKAKQVEIKKLATNYGIDNIPEGADRETATNLMADELQARYLNGDPLAAQGLQQLGRTDLVQAGGEQAISAAMANNQRYRDAVGKLNNMRNPGEYAAAYAELQQQTKDGMHGEHELASVPKTFDEFQKKKQQINNALSMQQMQIGSMQARMQQLGGVVPIQKSVDKDGNAIGLHAAISSQVRDNNGNPLGGVEPVTVGGIYNGNRLPSGSADINSAGVKWGLMSKDEIKDVGARIEPHKADLERASGINKLATITNAKDFSTNPFLFGHAVDQFVEISRNGIGGKGSATPGTVQMMENVRGHIQTWGDKAQKEWRQVEAWVDGGKKGEMPYVSQETKQQFQSAINTLKQGSDHEVGGTAGGTAEYVGRHGGKLDDLGLEPGVQDVLRDRWAKGNQEFKQDIASRPAVVTGGQRIVFDRDGVKPPTALTPGGFSPQPQSAPPSAPGAGAPPPAAPPANNGAPVQPGGGGGPQNNGKNGPDGGGPGAPITIAGQQVNAPQLPDGATPRYLTATQRIESGNEKNPWAAGNDKSSAGGAFQAIKSTWAANKPPGAPDDPRKATPQQQTDFAATLATKNAASLKDAGVEVNDTNLYVAHNLGGGGATALLRASPDADARSVVGEDAARNNPLFFKGRPTVATVLARYDAEMNGKAPASTDTSKLPDVGAAPWTGRTTPAGDTIATPEQRANSPVVNQAPAIGSTIGAMGGSVVAPGLGTMAGGGTGGAAGQAFQDWMQGRPQDPQKIAKQGALGAVLGIAGPEAAPLVGAAARVGGVAAISAGEKALEGGENSDILKAGLEGGAYALGGEALGKFVSMGGAQAYKALSRYTTSAQAELSASAGKLAEARATLANEPAKLPGDAGANPKYEAAQKMADDATQAIKDHGQNPDDMVHAYEQAKAAVPPSRGEALVLKGAASEKSAVSQGYDAQRKEFTDNGVGAVKPNQAVPQGPVSQLRTADNPAGKVPEQFRPEAEHAEMLIKAPAPNFGVKWQQLQNAGTELIQKRISFLANNDRPSADAMDNLFQGVRNQQKAVAEYVFGAERGAKVIGNLEELDTRYAKVMNATAGMDYKKMSGVLAQGNTPAARELETNFKAFAKGDPGAIRAFNAMKAGARGDWASEAKLMGPVIMGEVAANMGGVPTVGAISAVVGAHRLYKLVQGYMNARLLGKAVAFKDFLAQEIKTGLPQSATNGAQRNLVQGAAQGGQPQQSGATQ